MRQLETRSLPVAMYHYVSEFPNSIAVSPSIFEDHCCVLAEHGWRGISLDEAEGYCIDGNSLPTKSFLMTFDDGYFDNYINAMPIMARYGHQGVLFAVSDRIERETQCRVLVEDALEGRVPDMPEVNFPVQKNELGYDIRNDVFCNYAETRAMSNGDIMAVASHGKGHLGVFAGPGFSDFIRPGNQKRTFYRTNHEYLWGMPAFKVKPGLSTQAFIPSEDLVAGVKALVPQNNAEADLFFKDKSSVIGLRAFVQCLQQKNLLGRYETKAEQKKRMWHEIYEGKVALEHILGHKVYTLCWPWGAYSSQAVSLAREAGFTLLITTAEGINPPGAHMAVHRFKAKNQSGAWLLNRLRIYSSPLMGKLYTMVRL